MRRLRKKAGFSLSETMLALLIVALLSMSIATGVAFGARQYRRAMARSEARILCSSLAGIIQEELRNTTGVQTDGDDLEFFQSTHYQSGTELSSLVVIVEEDGEEKEQDEGYVAVKTGDEYFLLLGEAAYSGANDLKAKLDSVKCNTYEKEIDDGSKTEVYLSSFSVSLVIKARGAGEVRSDFDVIPLNEIKISAGT